MHPEIMDLLIIPFSLGISGLIFLGIAYFLKFKYSYRGGVKTSGVLTGFRLLDNDNSIGALEWAVGRGKYQDITYNEVNSKPVFRFYDGNNAIEQHSEWSVRNIQKSDIGKTFPIRYFKENGGKSYRIIMEGRQYELQREKGKKIIFDIFAGVGYGLIVLAVFVVVLYQLAV